jgi:hypothetical protein
LKSNPNRNSMDHRYPILKHQRSLLNKFT